MKSNSSNTSIYAALLANVGIAIIKFIAALATGSSSMLSEGIHSAVDSGNQILLLVGIKRSKRPADELHPFGHGQEMYFWSLIVAVLIFGLGGGISIYEGVLHIQHPETLENPFWNYIVLIVAFIFEGASFVIALRSFLAQKGKSQFWKKLKASKDPGLFVVIFEDGAAILGLLIAFLGVFFSHYFQMPELDGIASIIIGVLLAFVAVILIIESRNLLVGESMEKEKLKWIYEIASRNPEVIKVAFPLTMQLGPDDVLLALNIEFKDDLLSDELAKVISLMDRELKKAMPEIKHVFIEANVFNNDKSTLH